MWDTSQLYIAGMLGVAAADLPSGDFNGDGYVDAADYVIWRKGSATETGYDTWRSNFGQPPGAGTGAEGALPPQADVPEPATMVLLMFTAAGWCLWRRRSA